MGASARTHTLRAHLEAHSITRSTRKDAKIKICQCRVDDHRFEQGEPPLHPNIVRPQVQVREALVIGKHFCYGDTPGVAKHISAQVQRQKAFCKLQFKHHGSYRSRAERAHAALAQVDHIASGGNFDRVEKPIAALRAGLDLEIDALGRKYANEPLVEQVWGPECN